MRWPPCPFCQKSRFQPRLDLIRIGLLLDGQGILLPFPLHLSGGKLAEAVEAGWSEARTLGVQISDEQLLTGSVQVAKTLAPYISVLLYLCSEEPDLRDQRGKRKRPEKPVPVRTRTGPKEFPASSPTNWELGWRT